MTDFIWFNNKIHSDFIHCDLMTINSFHICIYIYICEKNAHNLVCLYLKMSNYNIFQKDIFFYLKPVIFRFVQKPS